MQLEILTFCDAAVEYGGRLNIVGATDTIVAPALPFQYDRCALALRLRATRIEAGEHTIHILLSDSDGRSLLDVEGKVGVRFDGAGLNGSMHLIVNAQGLIFPAYGEYALQVAVNGMHVGSSPLFVREETNRNTAALPPLPPLPANGV